MRVILQRVSHASCTIDGKVTGEIAQGYMVLVGICPTDTEEIVKKMADKIVKLRVYSDAEDKMNLSIQDIQGSILSISQFTLYANAKKGNRPSFVGAARPEQAIPLYDFFNATLSNFVPVQTGVFGADMKIDLCNDGPVTIILDSEELF